MKQTGERQREKTEKVERKKKEGREKTKAEI